jgi:hypothetical protein
VHNCFNETKNSFAHTSTHNSGFLALKDHCNTEQLLKWFSAIISISQRAMSSSSNPSGSTERPMQPAAQSVQPQFVAPQKRKNTGSLSRRRLSPWGKLRNSVHDKTFWAKMNVEYQTRFKSVDMARIITDSWLMEKTSNLGNLSMDVQPEFYTPKRQVELLEQTSNQLNEINTRVTQTLLQYETVNNQDDVFQLLDEEDDVQFTAGFDRKSIMEESKGKVKVLIGENHKIGSKRENVLSALKEWFEEMKKDELNDYEASSDDPTDGVMAGKYGEEAINNLLVSAHSAKDRLVEIHMDLVDCILTYHY